MALGHTFDRPSIVEERRILWHIVSVAKQLNMFFDGKCNLLKVSWFILYIIQERNVQHEEHGIFERRQRLKTDILRILRTTF